jgi:hypothetical protein
MSDQLLIVIPVDPGWEPTAEGASRAHGLMAELVGSADGLFARNHDKVSFIDPGENFESVSCPICDSTLTMEWWGERMDAAWTNGFEELEVVTPCCSSTTSLKRLEI